jgi:hypothetical protein
MLQAPSFQFSLKICFNLKASSGFISILLLYFPPISALRSQLSALLERSGREKKESVSRKAAKGAKIKNKRE